VKQLVQIAATLIALVAPACAGTIWEENWSSVDGWTTVEPVPIQASWKGENGTGTFAVANANTWVHFIPATRASINIKRLAKYVLEFDVKRVTSSMSYELDLDAFDAKGAYLRTITVYVQGTDIKSHSVTFNAIPKADWQGVAQVAPKVGLSSGRGDQQMQVGTFKIVETP